MGTWVPADAVEAAVDVSAKDVTVTTSARRRRPCLRCMRAGTVGVGIVGVENWFIVIEGEETVSGMREGDLQDLVSHALDYQGLPAKVMLPIHRCRPPFRSHLLYTRKKDLLCVPGWVYALGHRVVRAMGCIVSYCIVSTVFTAKANEWFVVILVSFCSIRTEWGAPE